MADSNFLYDTAMNRDYGENFDIAEMRRLIKIGGYPAARTYLGRLPPERSAAVRAADSALVDSINKQFEESLREPED